MDRVKRPCAPGLLLVLLLGAVHFWTGWSPDPKASDVSPNTAAENDMPLNGTARSAFGTAAQLLDGPDNANTRADEHRQKISARLRQSGFPRRLKQSELIRMKEVIDDENAQ